MGLASSGSAYVYLMPCKVVKKHAIRFKNGQEEKYTILSTSLNLLNSIFMIGAKMTCDRKCADERTTLTLKLQ